MDNVDDHPPRGSSSCVNGVLEKANFSKVNSEEKLEIIRRFLKNPLFDEVDLYYLGLLDEEEEEESLLSEEKKIPKGSLEETERSKKKSPNPNLDEINHLLFLQTISKGKRSKREKKATVVDVVFYDHSAPETEVAAEAPLLLKNPFLNRSHPLPLEGELTNKDNKKPKIIMSGKPIDTDCCCPIDDTSGPKEKKRPRTVDQQQEAEEDRAKKIRSSAPPPPPPKVPPKLKTRIEKLGGSQVMLVIEKELSLTDVTPRNGRFSLPLTKINLDFLTPGEREVLSGKTISGLPKPEIQSQLIQPCGEECTINLREWHMKKSPIYNLVTTWNDIVKTNSLDKGMTVQLWSFRVDSQLRLALVKAGKDIQ